MDSESSSGPMTGMEGATMPEGPRKRGGAISVDISIKGGCVPLTRAQGSPVALRNSPGEATGGLWNCLRPRERNLDSRPGRAMQDGRSLSHTTQVWAKKAGLGEWSSSLCSHSCDPTPHPCAVTLCSLLFCSSSCILGFQGHQVFTSRGPSFNA